MHLASSSSSFAQARRPSLLIADDDPVVRSMLSMALDRRFEIVAVATDAEAAVTEAALHLPDAALVDVDMPGGGAPSAVQGIGAASPATAIVVLSADESEASVLDLLKAGAMSYCRKGVDPQRLGDTIERSIDAHRKLRSDSAA